MTRHRRRERALAVCLAALAGYVDAVGFLKLGGYFVSFMSGNSTRLGINVTDGSVLALVPLGLIVLFVAGVVLGSLVGHKAGRKRQSRVLVGVGALLMAASVCQSFGFGFVAVAFMALSMGAENTVFERDGEVSIGLTYMTGTLVKLGQRITHAFLGGDRFGWFWYLLLWLGLVAGAVIGSVVYRRIGLDSLWLATTAAFVMSAVAAVIVERRTNARGKATGV